MQPDLLDCAQIALSSFGTHACWKMFIFCFISIFLLSDCMVLSGLVPVSRMHMVVERSHKHGFPISGGEHRTRQKKELRGMANPTNPF